MMGTGQGSVSMEQLALLLAVSRMFGVLTYTGDSKLSSAMGFLAILLSGVLQLLLLRLGIFLCGGLKEASMGAAKGPKSLYRVICGGYWLLCTAIAADTAETFTRFLSVSFYDWKGWWALELLFVLAAVLSARQGIEAICRAAALLGVLLAGLLLLIAAGLWDEYNLLYYSFAPAPAAGMLEGVLHGAAMNFEMIALLLLLPEAVNRHSPARSRWVIWTTAAAAGVQTMLCLSLGMYAEGKTFPMFAAAASAGFSVFQRLDAVFMAMWVITGFLRISVFLLLSARLWPQLCLRERKKQDFYSQGLIIAGAALFVGLCGSSLSFFESTAAAGAAVALGVILLPLAGRLVSREKRGEEK